MSVEVLVETDAAEKKAAVEAAGFLEAGTGPMFRGSRTIKYRQEP